MSAFAVRQAGPGDEEALAALDALCFGDSAWSLDSFTKEMNDNPFALYIVAETISDAELAEMAEIPSGVQAGEVGGSENVEAAGAEAQDPVEIPDPEIMGYVGLWLIAGEGHITNVAVHPDHRRGGVAKVLLKLILDACEEQGIKDVTLEVRPSNEAALGLYRGFGFKEEGRRPKYYENGEDALILWRRGK